MKYARLAKDRDRWRNLVYAVTESRGHDAPMVGWHESLIMISWGSWFCDSRTGRQAVDEMTRKACTKIFNFYDFVLMTRQLD